MYKKTVIAEIKKQYAIVIDEDGELHRIKLKKGMRIGDRIHYMDENHYRLVDQKKTRKLPRWIIGTIAAAAVFLLIAYQLFSGPRIPVSTTAETSEWDNQMKEQLMIQEEKQTHLSKAEEVLRQQQEADTDDDDAIEIEVIVPDADDDDDED